MIDKTADTAARGDSGRWIATGSLLGALLASSCCIAPFVLISLGVSGAWIGRLTALEPFQPVFVAVTLVLLAAGYWLVYFRKPEPCADGSYCARPQSVLLTKIALWIASALVLLALTVNLWAPLLY